MSKASEAASVHFGRMKNNELSDVSSNVIGGEAKMQLRPTTLSGDAIHFS